MIESIGQRVAHVLAGALAIALSPALAGALAVAPPESTEEHDSSCIFTGNTEFTLARLRVWRRTRRSTASLHVFLVHVPSPTHATAPRVTVLFITRASRTCVSHATRSRDDAGGGLSHPPTRGDC